MIRLVQAEVQDRCRDRVRAAQFQSIRLISMQRAAAIGFVLIPSVALANMGVGYFMVATPVVVVALVPAIIVEAPVLGVMLKTSLLRAAGLSLIANLVSTFFGFVLGLVADLLLGAASGSSGFTMTRASAAIMLVPWFFFSWWIEYRSIAKRGSEFPRPAVRRAAGAANLLTYAMMIAFALLSPFLPVRDPGELRVAVSVAILSASPLRTEVADHWSKHMRFPEGGKAYTDAGPNHRLRLEADGRISVTLTFPNIPELDGRRIVLAPSVKPGGSEGSPLTWTCRSPDLEPRFVPMHCRDAAH